MQPQVMTITPEIAMDMLTSNTRNRPLRPGVVAKYSGAMSRGEWRENGEAIKIATDGTLLDGQHRLEACIDSECSFTTLVITDLPVDAQMTMDGGIKRSASDRLSFAGESNTHSLAAALRKLLEYESEGTIGMHSAAVNRLITDQMLLTTLDRHPNIRDFVSTRYRIGALTDSSLTVFRYIVSQGALADRLDEFMDSLRSGEMLTRTNPILLLRSQVLRTTTSQMGRGKPEALLIKTWNSWLEGREVRSLMWRNDEDFPSLRGSGILVVGLKTAIGA